MVISIAGHTFSIVGLDHYIPKHYAMFEVDPDNKNIICHISQGKIDLSACTSEIAAEFRDGNGFTIVRKTNAGWIIECSLSEHETPYSRLSCNSDFSRSELEIIKPQTGRLAFDNAMMMQYAFATANRDTLLLHSSVVVLDGKGYLFQGKSGTGKSTHSRLWIENIAGAHLLNDDNPIVRIIDSKAVVCGSPWSGKTPCYHNESYPIGGIVRLWQRPHNSIRRLRHVEAFAALKPTASVLPCATEVEQGILCTVQQLAETAAVYSLECLPDADAALLCHDTITK